MPPGSAADDCFASAHRFRACPKIATYVGKPHTLQILTTITEALISCVLPFTVSLRQFFFENSALLIVDGIVASYCVPGYQGVVPEQEIACSAPR